MKIARFTTRVGRLAAALAVFAALAACTNLVSEILGSKSWGLVGTWSNATYGSIYFPKVAKVIFNADGSLVSKDTGGSTINGTYRIDDIAVSGDSRTFKIYAFSSSYWYVLARVTGSTLEIQADSYNYPPTINPADIYNYATYSLQ